VALPSEQVVARRQPKEDEEFIHRLARLFGDLEFDRPARLSLSDCRAVDLSPKTVERHVTHIYDKVGISTRAGDAIYALENGLL
jgi:hypothetical protein